MADVEIEISVDSDADLGGPDLADEELRLKVRRGANPCMRCRLNEDPEKVPLHPRCECRVVVEKDGAIINVLR